MANMFGALNRFISRLDSDPLNPSGPNNNLNTSNNASSTTAYAFQVLRNSNPNLPLEPWFDFLIGLNGRTIDSADPSLLAAELRNCAGATISLGAYSAKGQAIRELYAHVPGSDEKPSTDGAGPDSGVLGLTLQWAPLAATDDVWHILDVSPNSPADVAGLLPYSDYVVGSPERDPLRGEASLGELVEAFLDRPLRLYVYNTEYDVVRLVTITPSRGWGGDGALGCLLGYGALHRLPAPLGEPTQAPGETLFESADAQDSTAAPAEFLVPADMPLNATAAPPRPAADGAASATSPPPPPPPSAAGKARKARAHHSTAPTGGLDDYFAEGEQKSRELDHGSGGGGKGSDSLPPPPKGGPPRGPSPAVPAAAEE